MSDFLNKKAFILGGSGLIGSAVIKKLTTSMAVKLLT